MAMSRIKMLTMDDLDYKCQEFECRTTIVNTALDFPLNNDSSHKRIPSLSYLDAKCQEFECTTTVVNAATELPLTNNSSIKRIPSISSGDSKRIPHGKTSEGNVTSKRTESLSTVDLQSASMPVPVCKEDPEIDVDQTSKTCCICFGMNYAEMYCLAFAPGLTVTSIGVIETLWAPYIYLSEHNMTALGICMLLYGLAGAASDIIIQRIPNYSSQMHSSQPLVSCLGWIMLIVDDMNLLYPAVFLISFGKALTANQTCLYLLKSDITIERRASIRAQIVSFAWIVNFLQFLVLVNLGKDTVFSIIALTAFTFGIMTMIFYQYEEELKEQVEVTLRTLHSTMHFGAFNLTDFGSLASMAIMSGTLGSQHTMDFTFGRISTISSRDRRNYNTLHNTRRDLDMSLMESVCLQMLEQLSDLLPLGEKSLGWDSVLPSAKSATTIEGESSVHTVTPGNSTIGITAHFPSDKSGNESSLKDLKLPAADAHSLPDTSKIDWLILGSLLTVIFWSNFLEMSYLVMFSIIWLDQYNSPDIWVSFMPIIATATQGLALYSYQFFDWKILHELPYNIMFFVCARVLTYLVFLPGTRPPFTILLLIHWFEIVEYYSFSCAEIIARSTAGEDLLYINACANVIIMGASLIAGTIMPILYNIDYLYFQVGITFANMIFFVSGLVFFFILLQTEKFKRLYTCE